MGAGSEMNTIPVTDKSGQPAAKPRRRGCLFLLKWVFIALVAILLAGLVYQAVATESDRTAYPPPGQLYNVDGHQMHITCVGEGSPTIILEAAGGHFSATWAWVQSQLADSTRVCAYDRAGYGWSEPGPEPRDAKTIAAELHTLLETAGIQAPYVIAGHSVGGIYIRVYNAQYPGEVVGMVLVDATHPDNWARQGESIETLQGAAGVSAVLARFGLMRLFANSQPFDLPAEASAALRADIASSQYWDTQRADTAAMAESLSQARAAGDLDDLPLVVLSAVDYPEGQGQDTERALQEELAALSSNSLAREIPGAHHITLLTNPDYAQQVSAAILQVVEAAQTGQPLAQ